MGLGLRGRSGTSAAICTPWWCTGRGMWWEITLERFGWRRAKTMEVRCYEAPFDEGESVYLVASGSPEAKGPRGSARYPGPLKFQRALFTAKFHECVSLCAAEEAEEEEEEKFMSFFAEHQVEWHELLQLMRKNANAKKPSGGPSPEAAPENLAEGPPKKKRCSKKTAPTTAKKMVMGWRFTEVARLQPPKSLCGSVAAPTDEQ